MNIVPNAADESTLLADVASPKLRFEVSGVTAEGTRTLLFIHGWPDDERSFFLQTSHFASFFRVVNVRLPWFGTVEAAEEDAAQLSHSRAGYSLQAVAESVAQVAVEMSPYGPITCVAHDWGAIFAQMADLAHPGLFDSMVCIDVALFPWMLLAPRWNFRDIIGMSFLGFLYQWPAALGYMIYDRVPRIAGWLGSGIARKSARSALWNRPAVKALCERDPEALSILGAHPAHAGVHPLCGFVYERLQCSFWGGLFARLLRRTVQPVVLQGPQLDHWSDFPNCPILFMYGGSTASFHSKKWEQKVLARNDGSHVIEFKSSGHWVQIEKADELNREMKTWLERISRNVCREES